MILAIVGTRNLDSYKRFKGRLEFNFLEVPNYPALSPPALSEFTEFVSGGAKGTDTHAVRLAEELGIPIKVFLPEYDKYGKNAPLIRNTQIVDYADQVVAFIDDQSRGTWDIVNKAREAKKDVYLIKLDDDKEEVLESWVREGLCPNGFQDHKESARIDGYDCHSPHPNYRLTIWERGNKEEPSEGGYFHYREDAERMKEYLEQVLSLDNVIIKLDTLPEKDYEFKENNQ